MAAFALSASACAAIEQNADLTGTDAKTFRAHVGQMVCLRGRLAAYNQGGYLVGVTADKVDFRVIPLLLMETGPHFRNCAFVKLQGKQVRVTGQLKFLSDEHYSFWKAASGYYYMDADAFDTKIEPLRGSKTK